MRLMCFNCQAEDRDSNPIVFCDVCNRCDAMVRRVSWPQCRVCQFYLTGVGVGGGAPRCRCCDAWLCRRCACVCSEEHTQTMTAFCVDCCPLRRAKSLRRLMLLPLREGHPREIPAEVIQAARRALAQDGDPEAWEMPGPDPGNVCTLPLKSGKFVDHHKAKKFIDCSMYVIEYGCPRSDSEHNRRGPQQKRRRTSD